MAASSDLAQKVQSVIAQRLTADEDLRRCLRQMSARELKGAAHALAELSGLVADELGRRTEGGGACGE